MGYELRAVTSPADWADLHAIRREVLFGPGRLANVTYDETNPDDRHPDQQPLLLVLDGQAIGVVRLDRRGDEAGVVRLVGISSARQRQGHGRMLQQLVDDEGRRRGMRRLAVNAHSSAVGFYERTGWTREDWDPTELTGLGADCVQMVKII